MAQIFSEWANRAPVYVAAALGASALLAPLGVWYFFSPRFTDVGYQPRQPVAFSHRLHAGELEIDCRYCHVTVEISPVASVPPTRLCMNCHQLVGRKLESLALLRESVETGEPIHWVRVHDLPDYAYFDHSLHLRAGLDCSSCHGDVTGMVEVSQVEPLSMGWCLDCHRRPGAHLREGSVAAERRVSPARAVSAALRSGALAVDPPTDCSGCHR